MKFPLHKDALSAIFIAELFTIENMGNQLRCLFKEIKHNPMVYTPN